MLHSPIHIALGKELDYLRPIVVSDLARFGNSGDGGYVLSLAALQNVGALISFGIADDWSFESDLSNRYADLLIHAYDHTVDERIFLRSKRMAMKAVLFGVIKRLLHKLSSDDLKRRIRHYRACASTCYNYPRFFGHGNHKHFRERVFNRAEDNSDATIDKVFERVGNRSNIVLKIDIDGGEYRIIRQCMAYADRISIVAIEFHDTDPLRSVFFEQIQAIRQEFNVIHVHGNNNRGVGADGLPECLEITFLHKRFPTETHHRTRLPLAGLDFPSNAGKTDYVLEFSR